MKEGAPIRFLLVALPAGLLVLGVLAMVASHFRAKEKPADANEAVRLEAASLMRSPVSRNDLSRTIETLTVRIGERHRDKPEALESAAFWLESTLGGGNIGYRVERHAFEVEGKEFRNLIAELPGRDRRDEIIVVGAHYDSPAGSPGALDNGSGVAAMLALARAFAGDPQERTVRFVAFANGANPEAAADAKGSFSYAKRCQARGEKIVAMLSLDSIGGISDGGMIVFTGDANSRFFVDSAKGAFAVGSPIPAIVAVFPESGPAGDRSDHASFWSAGYSAVMASGNTPEATGTSDAIDLGNLEDATRGFEAIVRVWANP